MLSFFPLYIHRLTQFLSWVYNTDNSELIIPCEVELIFKGVCMISLVTCLSATEPGNGIQNSIHFYQLIFPLLPSKALRLWNLCLYPFWGQRRRCLERQMVTALTPKQLHKVKDFWERKFVTSNDSLCGFCYYIVLCSAKDLSAFKSKVLCSSPLRISFGHNHHNVKE